MASGDRLDDLVALSEPTVGTDRQFVGRSGELYRQDVSALRGGFMRRPQVLQVLPGTSDFGTWLNQNSATITAGSDALQLESAHLSPGQVIARYRSTPSGNWDVQIGTRKNWITKNFLLGGLMLRESATGKLETFGYGHRSSGGLLSGRWNSVSSYFGDRQAYGDYFDTLFIRARKIATLNQIAFYWSQDGYCWTQHGGGFALNNFFTTAPDQWGIFVQPINQGTPNNSQRLDVFHWSEGSDVDLTPGVPCYANPEGTLNRTGTITVTTDATLSAGTIDNLVDGGFNNDATDAVLLNNGQTLRQITFQFPNAKIITEAKWFQNATQSNGTWKWQGSNNGSTFVDLSATFTLDDTTSAAEGTRIGDLSANATAYLYYRLQQTAGTTSNAQRLKEIEFKLCRG